MRKGSAVLEDGQDGRILIVIRVGVVHVPSLVGLIADEMPLMPVYCISGKRRIRITAISATTQSYSIHFSLIDIIMLSSRWLRA